MQLSPVGCAQMLKRTYENQNCPIAATLEQVGERWSLLILRNVFFGVHRFDELQRDLGIARNTLRDRLALLVDEGILVRRRYQERPERFEYRLTAKGTDLWPVLHALMSWGDKHAELPAGPPTVIEHRGCGGHIDERRICERCGELAADVHEIVAKPGPGASPRHPLRRVAA
jgi:DNA-binding HxlR family transcriptional regulator